MLVTASKAGVTDVGSRQMVRNIFHGACRAGATPDGFTDRREPISFTAQSARKNI